VISFDWGGGSPLGLPIDAFSIKWTGRIIPRFSGLYTFYTLADDGAILTINGITIISEWTTHPATEYSGTINLVAGQQYNIELDYNEVAGGASIQLLWSMGTQEPKAIIPSQQLLVN